MYFGFYISLGPLSDLTVSRSFLPEISFIIESRPYSFLSITWGCIYKYSGSTMGVICIIILFYCCLIAGNLQSKYTGNCFGILQ